MKKQSQGHIINISSVAAGYGVPYLGAYGASKAALSVVSQSLRAELHDTGIHISLVYPGYTDTAFFENELKLGNVRRPEGPYMPVKKVTEVIVKVIKEGKGDRVLSTQGKALYFLKYFFPVLTRKLMRKLAVRLRQKPFHHEKAKTTHHRIVSKPW